MRIGLLGAAFGMAVAATGVYGCGADPECDPTIQESVGGRYDGTFEVTEDEKGLTKEKTGDIALAVIPLNPKDSRVELGLFEWHEFDRDNKGNIGEKWTAQNGIDELSIYGNISNGRMELDACVDSMDFWTEEEYKICWYVEGDKIEKYSSDEEGLQSLRDKPAVRLQDMIRR